MQSGNADMLDVECCAFPFMPHKLTQAGPSFSVAPQAPQAVSTQPFIHNGRALRKLPKWSSTLMFGSLFLCFSPHRTAASLGLRAAASGDKLS